MKFDLVELIQTYPNHFKLFEDTQKELTDSKDLDLYPMAPGVFESSNKEILLSDQVMEELNKLIKYSTSEGDLKEIPFILCGQSFDDLIAYTKIYYALPNTYPASGKLEDMISTFEDVPLELLESASASYDKYILEKLHKSFPQISIGHNHPCFETKEDIPLVADKLSDELKEEYGIRKTGLNLSYGDIWQIHALTKKSIEINQDNNSSVTNIVVLPNGEISINCVEDNKLKRFSKIYDLDGNKLSVPASHQIQTHKKI